MTHPTISLIIKFLMFLSMLIGLFSMIIPAVPGHAIILIITLIYGLVFTFGIKGLVISVVLVILAIAGEMADNVFMGAKAIEKGAHWLSLLVAALCGIIGSLFLTPIGGIFTAMLGLFVSEYIAKKDHEEALNVTKSVMVGWGWALIVRLGIGILMIGLWGIWAFT